MSATPPREESEMTTNIERAADLIADATIPPGTSIRRGMDRAILATKLLADAGLLMPDLPMAEEVEYRIVDPDTNGGEYELRRWSRHVTEWTPS